MAFGITHKTSGGTNTDATSFTTASISVAAGDLIMAFVSSGTAAATTPLPTSVTGLSLTWTNPTGGDVLMNSSSVGRTSVWYAVATGAASGTITFDFGAGNTQSNCQWEIVTITGADNSNPIVQVDTLRTATTNPSMTISPAPGAANMVIGAMHANIATAPTAGSGWTLIGGNPVFAGSSPALGQTCQYDLTAPSATFNFTLSSATNKGLIAVEIAPSSTPAYSGWGIPI